MSYGYLICSKLTLVLQVSKEYGNIVAFICDCFLPVKKELIVINYSYVN